MADISAYFPVSPKVNPIRTVSAAIAGDWIKAKMMKKHRNVFFMRKPLVHQAFKSASGAEIAPK
jgi:hypothetical protein